MNHLTSDQFDSLVDLVVTQIESLEDSTQYDKSEGTRKSIEWYRELQLSLVLVNPYTK